MPTQRCRLTGHVDTLQWTGSNASEVIEFLGHSAAVTIDMGLQKFQVDFVDRHGVVRSANQDDYLVRGVDGNIFPVSPHFHAENYEPEEAGMGEQRHRALAEIAYWGYRRHTGGKTFDGRDMPVWPDLPEHTVQAWTAAVRAISEFLDQQQQIERAGQIAAEALARLAQPTPASAPSAVPDNSPEAVLARYRAGE